MFKDSYRKKIDETHVRESLLDEIKTAGAVQERAERKKKDRRRQWMIAIPAVAVAAAACVAVFVGVRTGKASRNQSAETNAVSMSAEVQTAAEGNGQHVKGADAAEGNGLHVKGTDAAVSANAPVVSEGLDGTAVVPVPGEPASEEPEQDAYADLIATAVEPVGSYEELGQIIEARINNSGRYIYGGGWAVNEAEPVPEEMPMAVETAAEPDMMTDAGMIKYADDMNDGSGRSYSGTNVQVEGIDEADIVKTDGMWIYALNQNRNKIYILSAEGKDSEIVGTIKLREPKDTDMFSQYYDEMMLYGDRLYLLGNYYNYDWNENVKDEDRQYTIAEVYDVSDRTAPKHLTTLKQQGNYRTARLIDDLLVIVSDYHLYIWCYPVSGIAPYVDYCPRVAEDDVKVTLLPDEIYVNPDSGENAFTVITAINAADGTAFDSHKAVLGGCNQVYCNGTDILIASAEYSSKQSDEQTDPNGKHFVKIVSGEYTNLFRFTITDRKIEAVASTKFPGTLLNQFSMDEYNGYYRLVVTRNDYEQIIWTDGIDTYEGNSSSECNLLVLDGDLNVVGRIEELAKDERVQSVRFMGDVAYFVTFRQVDPLFSADLSDPTDPKILGTLKIPGFSAYLHPFGAGKLLGIGYDADEEHGWTENIKLSMFDISDPSDVKEAFKLSVKDVNYTSVQYNHKIVFVDVASQTIAFPADNAYYVFRVDGDTFKQIGKIETDSYYWFGDGRGLFVEDAFYVIGDHEVTILSFETMEKLAKIELP